MVGLLGVLAEAQQQPSPKMKKTSMAAPWGVPSVVSAAATTEVEDVDDGPLTSMVICSEFCKKDVGSNK
jgi:hypothetical protein